MSLIYYVVPKGHVPWRGVWPGALFVTVTTAIGNAAFPVYLTSISDLDRTDPVRRRFGALHGISMVLLLSQTILAAAVVLMRKVRT